MPAKRIRLSNGGAVHQTGKVLKANPGGFKWSPEQPLLLPSGKVSKTSRASSTSPSAISPPPAIASSLSLLPVLEESKEGWEIPDESPPKKLKPLGNSAIHPAGVKGSPEQPLLLPSGKVSKSSHASSTSTSATSSPPAIASSLSLLPVLEESKEGWDIPDESPPKKLEPLGNSAIHPAGVKGSLELTQLLPADKVLNTSDASSISPSAISPPSTNALSLSPLPVLEGTKVDWKVPDEAPPELELTAEQYEEVKLMLKLPGLPKQVGDDAHIQSLGYCCYLEYMMYRFATAVLYD